MAYSPTYVQGDLSSIIVDIIGNFGVQIAGFAGLIALTAVIGYLFVAWRKSMKGQ